tara:strand:+ start:5007 stop:5486 length:480 start_codon:yes stop_codon:yes gene_type:complete
MNHLQNCKLVNVVAPVSLSGATATVANKVDTSGFGGGELLLVVSLGATAGTVSALKVQESDDDSTYSDVTGCVVATSLDIEGGVTDLPDATGDDNGLYVFQIQLTASRKRYFTLVATEGASSATLFSCLAVLSPAGLAPVDTNAAIAGAIVDTAIMRAS